MKDKGKAVTHHTENVFGSHSGGGRKLTLASVFECVCGSRGPRWLPSSFIVLNILYCKRGWVAKVPVNSDVEKAGGESSVYHVFTLKTEKKTCMDMPIFFFIGTLYFCVDLFLEMMCPHTYLCLFCTSVSWFCFLIMCSRV